MKKTSLTTLIAILFCPVAFAGGIHNTGRGNVSYMAKQDFRADFPKVETVKWSRDKQYSEATFINKGEKMHAFYNWEGNLSATTHHFSYADLPDAAKKTIARQYKNYTVEKTILYNDNEDNLNALYPLVPYEYRTNYFVLLKKNDHPEKVILHVTPDGSVSYFKTID